MYQKTKAFDKILKLKKRLRCVQGGTAASKTISILLYLIERAQLDKNPTITSIVSESFPHLRRGVIRDFLDILTKHNYFEDSQWSKSDFIYTFPSGSKIEFFSADQPGKVRGPRRERLFINEANNISFETFTQLEIRTRDFIFLDWNPTSDAFWFYSEIQNKRKDYDFIILNYLDNEALNQAIINSIEARKDNKNWYKVYGLGLLGEIETRIYRNWKIIDEIPHEARLERYGLDFGYTNNETAIVAIYYHNGGYILHECLYKKGLSNKDIANAFQAMQEKLIIADSAEPKSIDELKSYGLNVMPAQKGKDSVRQGIQLIQDQPISITKSSVNLLKEYRNYLWMTDKNGKIINEPNKFQDHLLDGCRYALSTMARIEPPKNYWDRIWEKELMEVGKEKPKPNLGR